MPNLRIQNNNKNTDNSNTNNVQATNKIRTLRKLINLTHNLKNINNNNHSQNTNPNRNQEITTSNPHVHNHNYRADRVAEYSDEDEEGEFSSGEFNDDAAELGIPGYDPKRDYNPSKHDMRKYRKLQRSEVEDVALGTNPVDSDSEFEMKDKSSSRAKISRVSTLAECIECRTNLHACAFSN